MQIPAAPPAFESYPSTGGADAWQSTRNLVLVRLDDVGELPSYASICRVLNGGRRRRLTLLTSKAGASMKAQLGDVDDVLAYEAPWVDGRLRSGAADRRFLGKLASCRFDGAILCTRSMQSALPAALFCRMAGIALRLGHSRENPYGLLTDWVPEPESYGAGGDLARQLRLVRSVGFDVPEPTALSRLVPNATEPVTPPAAAQPIQFFG